MSTPGYPILRDTHISVTNAVLSYDEFLHGVRACAFVVREFLSGLTELDQVNYEDQTGRLGKGGLRKQHKDWWERDMRGDR